MVEVFVQISLVILIAVVVSAIMRILRQPLIIGYIITGIIVGPYIFNLMGDFDIFDVFSKIGVALLLFMVGLHMNPKVIKEVGKISLITGIGQVIFTTVCGYFLSLALGFNSITSIYIAVAISFSSTIIIMKLLSDKGDVESVHGKIAIGFLIVQDLIAIFVLMFISSISSGLEFNELIISVLVKGFLSIFILILVSIYVLPPLVRLIAKSQEFLFLFSIGWCLLLSSVFFLMDFSIEIGALLAGVSLSMLPYTNEISSKMKPLRDFFIVLFFIVVGSQMVIGDIRENIVPVILFSGLILIGNPIIVMTLMGFMNYKKRIGFMAGLTVAQISEFSLILIALGVSVGHIDREILSLMTVIGLITIAGTTYLITYSNQIYSLLDKYLSIFERKSVKSNKKLDRNYDALLLGYNRVGFSILNSFKRIHKKYLVVDYNPDVISDLNKLRIPALYGDVYDSDFLQEELPLSEAKLIVSTIPDFETNTLILRLIKKRENSKTIVILRAQSIDDALSLYKMGADYVLTPHILGGEYVAKIISDYKLSKEGYEKEKDIHINSLKERKKRKINH
jgi:Kef-type K+ transport system membrane component KefB